MDNPGWHAIHKDRKSSTKVSVPERGPDGRFQPIEQVMPIQTDINAALAGGFTPGLVNSPLSSNPAHAANELSNGNRVTSTSSGYTPSSRIAGLSAVERSQIIRMARMDPFLQLMAGPLLRYDTVDQNGVWRGAVLVLTADAGSSYDPLPMLKYGWDLDAPPRPWERMNSKRLKSFDLGPHPADPHSTASISEDGNSMSTSKMSYSMNIEQHTVPGQEIWVYTGNGGTFTFWRFAIEIQLSLHEMRIQYSVNNGQTLEFYVPGTQDDMRLAIYSCNGFSAGVNADDFRGPGFLSGYDPVWTDLLEKHADRPFHALVGGGDQLYCDGVIREPELQDWVTRRSPEERRKYPVTEEITEAIDRFFFNHYCSTFRSGAFARANSSIPMMNMCDDHDLIDGFGSYPDDWQRAPVFQMIGHRGFFFYLLFQCFINVEVDGVSDNIGEHLNMSLIIGGPGPYVGFPSHSFLSYLGPHSWILLLDCRAERRKDQVCSPLEYQKVFDRLYQLPSGTEHLVVQLGIPIAYPRMVFLETMLESKFNPLVALARFGTIGLSSLVNKFNSEAELLDDLNDHWTAKTHKRERNWLIEQFQQLARTKRIRVTFVSGDVHCGAVGVLKTLAKGKPHYPIPPAEDHRYMLNVVSSAIVNTPPPPSVISMVSALATKTHRTMHYADTDESMIPLFEHETNGTLRKHKYIMGARNWCVLERDDNTGELVFDIRVEKERGHGQTVGYAVRTPPPQWKHS